ncbi:MULTISPECIES: hypothetical protein [Acidobacteriaceae]|uniref:hypothetical protein n=1 Tax=Acidobacteriaceae TaxID=204434 RepID=UPI00131E7B9F|nr:MULTISPECIES: hypothetical protein [Acidobacteriaceae]MDW5267620.1 hypothetical protein [Edaphobacter sp.]
MKLQFDEIVKHSDADLVLRTLEQHLREVSLETVRTEDELIVYGLGPSFRTMNPNDKTVVRATSQPDATTLHTEANFLASALAGNVAQDEIVRSKIERAFESLKAELNYSAASRQTTSWTLPATEPAPPDPVVETIPVIAEGSPAAPIEAKEISPAPINRAPDVMPTTSIESKSEPQPESKIESQAESKPEPSPEPTPVPKNAEPTLTAPRRSTLAPPAAMEAAPTKRRQSAILLVLPLLLLLLAAAIYFLQRPHSSQSLYTAKPEGHTASASVENQAAAPVPDPPATAVAPPQPVPAAMPTDIKAWVQAWAAAIRTRDVQSQLSFYATPLDRYFLTPDVSREQLLNDKQVEIDNRKGLWTFKAEDVVVQKKTAASAVVTLIKHIIVELPSSVIQEQRIKAQLKLKLVDGSWKITSERTIG